MKIVSVALRYFKCYESTQVVPLFFDDQPYVGFIGENGVGKSAILEALHSFFTNEEWIRNKTGKKGETTCGVAPIVYCTEDDLPKKNFSPEDIKEIKKYSRLLRKAIGKHIATNESGLYVSCISFQSGEIKLFDGSAAVTDSDLLAAKVKQFIIDSFKYIHIGAEVDINNSTDINSKTTELIKGSGAVDEITKILQGIKIETREGQVVSIANLINAKVIDYLDNDVIKKLQQVDRNYNYKNLKTGAQSKLSEKRISELAAQALLSNRGLTKKIKSKDIGISDMSSGQRRKAFLDFVVVMVSNLDQKQRERVILAIDEPEISVDASSRIQQFDKLKGLSELGPNVMFTTHWYGWIAQLMDGNAVLVKETEGGKQLTPSSIEKFLEKDAQIKVPYEMRMMFDFLSSLGTWAEIDPTMKFVLCEGRTDHAYITRHFPNYKTIPLRGRDEVVRLYKIFSDYYFRVDKKPSNIIFLIDTDPEKAAELRDFKGGKRSNLRRISRDGSGQIKIVTSDDNYSEKCAIEDLLSPQPLLAALVAISADLAKAQQDFINGLAIKYPEETGMRAFGLDDKQKQELKEIFKLPDFKLQLALAYNPSNEEKTVFKNLLDLS